jgi:hypothetical protein
MNNAAANRTVDSLSNESLSEVAALGYKGPLPEGVATDADSEFEFRNAVQDIAKCIEAGACRRY